MRVEKQIQNAADTLIETIRTSETYRSYRDSVGELTKQPEVLEAIGRMRMATIDSYEHSGQEDLVEISNRLDQTFGELMRQPEVQLYLEAETALIRSLQSIRDQVLGAVDLYVPELDSERTA